MFFGLVMIGLALAILVMVVVAALSLPSLQNEELPRARIGSEAAEQRGTLDTLMRRLRWAWRFKVWPWKVPASVIQYLSLAKVTERDIQRTKELAKQYGWEVAD